MFIISFEPWRSKSRMWGKSNVWSSLRFILWWSREFLYMSDFYNCRTNASEGIRLYSSKTYIKIDYITWIWNNAINLMGQFYLTLMVTLKAFIGISINLINLNDNWLGVNLTTECKFEIRYVVQCCRMSNYCLSIMNSNRILFHFKLNLFVVLYACSIVIFHSCFRGFKI